jgi:RNA polymerase sigma-70 factor, ECF subfamily
VNNLTTIEIIENLYLEHYSYLKNYLIKLTKSEDEADEIIQELFSKLLTNPKSIQKVNYKKSWLVACSRNILIDKYRKFKPTLLKEDNIIEYILIEHNTPESIGEVKSELDNLLSNLNKSEKAILLAKEYYGYSYEEMSDLFNLTISNLKTKVFRVKKKLWKLRGELNE